MIKSHQANRTTAEARMRRATVGFAAVVAGVVAFTSFTEPAVAAPERVLQAVQVDLNSDAQVTSIVSSTVSDVTEKGEAKTQELKVGDLASKLPVRVQTAWYLDGRSGSDLADIEGESGRVVVEVTVQNTTVRPREVTYDSNGVSKSRFALVGTPLTVVASADLGKDTYDTVVIKDDMEPDVVTNGVVANGAENAAQVQWAALLAPPRLGATTTMRLVQNTDDFKAPTINLNVQPGLITDPSMSRLVHAAFSGDSTSSYTLESRTIQLVSDINATLIEASGVLGKIQQELGGVASELGAQTISDLQASSTQVTSSLGGLATDLKSLSSDVGQRLTQTNDATTRQLQTSLEQVSAALGDPNAKPATPNPVATCSEKLPKLDTDATVMDQLSAVSGQLDALSAATGACSLEIQQKLSNLVGLVKEDGSCAPAGSAACQLINMGVGLGNELDDLLAYRDSFAARFKADLIGNLVANHQVLNDAIADLNTQIRNLKGGGTGSLDKEIASINTSIAAAKAVLLPADQDSLETQAATVAEELRSASSDLTDALGKRSGKTAADQLAEIRDLACAQVDNNNKPTAAAEAISNELVGAPCGDLPADHVNPAESLAGRFAEISAVIGALDSAATSVESLADAFADLEDAVVAAESTGKNLQTFQAPQLNKRVQELVCKVTLLTVPEADTPKECGTVGESPATVSPVHALSDAVAAVESNQRGLTSVEIEKAFAAVTGLLASSSVAATLGGVSVSKTGVTSGDDIGVLMSELQTQLSGTGDAVLEGGSKAVTKQRNLLAKSVKSADVALTLAVQQAVADIATDVTASTKNLKASEQMLLSDLRKVLLDLGERKNNGSGLLGSLMTGATQTGVSNTQIRSASDSATAFGRVRESGLDDLRLQQSQLATALRLQNEFGPFGIELPAGSSHLTTFTYRLGGQR